jgi:hypothetical protein
MNKHELIKMWCKDNIFHRSDNFVKTMKSWKLLSDDDINNLTLHDEYYNKHKQSVIEWYVVSDAAYNKFNGLFMPVFKIDEVSVWGRTQNNITLEEQMMILF